MFSMYPDDISEDQLDEYIQLVTAAETAVLREAEVILCTCVTSGQRNLATVTNVQQVGNLATVTNVQQVGNLATVTNVQQVGNLATLPVVH